MEPLVSIIIPHKNSINVLINSLPVILEQDFDQPFEVIIVDSGSTDGSIRLIKNYLEKDTRLRLLEIEPDSFHHAKTRNLGIRHAKGRYVVFLNGDALPTHTTWLHNLVSPMMQDGNIVATYGRQEPDIKADINNLCRMTFNYGPEPLLKRGDSPLSVKDKYFFSSANCCIDSGRFEETLFDEKIPVNEDVVFSRKVLDLGHSIAYIPDANVTHSHNLSPSEVFCRYFDNGAVYKKIGIIGKRGQSLNADGKKYLKHSLEVLKTKQPSDWLSFFVFSLFAVLGSKMGEYSSFFPKSFRKKISRYAADIG